MSTLLLLIFRAEDGQIRKSIYENIEREEATTDNTCGHPVDENETANVTLKWNDQAGECYWRFQRKYFLFLQVAYEHKQWNETSDDMNHLNSN